MPQGLRVASVLPDTPAEKAGIEQGDLIVAVDGKSIAGIPSDVSTARIKGPAGDRGRAARSSPPAGAAAKNVELERADVRVPAVKGAMRRDADGDKIAYVRFATFSEGAHGELRDEVERLYRRGAEGLVLDLRDNGGGLLNEAVLCTSIFLDHGNVVSTRSRTQGDQDYPAIGDAIEPAPDGGADRPRHGLRGRDPDRGAPAERPRRRGRHPHLRQGHLSGDHGPRLPAAPST